MIRQLFFSLFATLLVLGAPLSRAQEPAPLYQVEVLVFTTGALKGWTEEYWPVSDNLKEDTLNESSSLESVDDPSVKNDSSDHGDLDRIPPAETDTNQSKMQTELQQLPPVTAPVSDQPETRLYLDDLLAGIYPENAPFWLTQIRAVKPEERILQQAIQRLTPQKGYRIVAYYSWVQPAIDKKTAQPLGISGETPYGDTLDGRVLFYKQRYAHIALTLDMTRRIPAAVREAFAQQEGISVADLPESWTFHINETRKLKSNAWHYFDHPLFGALAVIRRVTTRQ